MSDLITVRNNTGEHKTVYYGAAQYVLEPWEERALEPSLAEAFIRECSPAVTRLDMLVSSVQKETNPTKTLWIANMTGDPDAPDQVDTRQWDRQAKRHVMVKTENMRKAPRTLRHEEKGSEVWDVPMDAAQAETFNYNGKISVRLPPKMYALEPYKRIELPAHTAKWFLGRDSVLPIHERGQVIVSRPPTEFEPTGEWPLNQMRAYLKMIDPSVKPAQLGVTEEEILASGKTGRELDQELAAAKSLMLKRIRLRIFNPKYRQPSKEEFFAIYHAEKKQEKPVDPSVAAALVDKALKSTVPAQKR